MLQQLVRTGAEARIHLHDRAEKIRKNVNRGPVDRGKRFVKTLLNAIVIGGAWNGAYN